MHRPTPFTALIAAALMLSACHSTLPPVRPGDIGELDRGYSALASLLNDERQVHNLLAIKPESQPVSAVVRDISATSAAAHDDLRELRSLEPPVMIDQSPDLPLIERSARDAIAAETAKDLLLSGDSFDVRLLLSQAQALRYGEFLARKLGEADPNTVRTARLDALADDYDRLYEEVIRILAGPSTDDSD